MKKKNLYGLVDIAQLCPSILLDIRYATYNNFTNQPIYSSARCFLQKHVAQALVSVQKELQKQNLGLKIWDGYRPLSMQKILWDLIKDPRYVADPALGSRHNNGCAVDCTLVDSDGNELPMPSLFDDFSERAHRDYKKTDLQALQNSQLLEQVMKKHGFIGLPTEWWHFDHKSWKMYPFLDISFEES